MNYARRAAWGRELATVLGTYRLLVSLMTTFLLATGHNDTVLCQWARLSDSLVVVLIEVVSRTRWHTLDKPWLYA